MSPRHLLSILTFIVVSIVYLKTLAPTVMFIDSGELAADASTLGIAHPTGYPLFILIGYLFTKLPISSSEVYNLNLMGAIFCMAGVITFFYLMHFLFSSDTEKFRDKKNILKQSPYLAISMISTSAALVLAFSNTFWAQANSVEVYSLHIFFLITLIYIFLKAITASPLTPPQRGGDKVFLLFSFVLGLSFTNHMTTILLAPACLTLFFVSKRNEGKRILKLLGYMALCFIAGFSLYLYLPIRARMNPMFLWGNPYNLERFIWHITGKQFSIWIFSGKGSIAVFIILLITLEVLSIAGLLKQKSFSKHYHTAIFIILSLVSIVVLKSSNEIVVKQFNFFLDSLWNEFGPGVVILGLIGVYRLSKYNLNIYYFSILAFFGCIFYSVNYDIHDIASYFLLSYIIIAVWIGFGALMVYEKVSLYFKTNFARILFAGVIVLVSGITLKSNYEENDESKEYYVEEFTMNTFRNAEPNSIIISSQWDFWLSASWYFQGVKNIRPDLIIIDKELMRRSWYYIYLKRHYPEIYENSKPEIEKFLVELDKFEHNIPYDTRTIMKAFTDVLTSIAEKNPEKNVYTTWEIEQNKEEAFAQNYERIPNGILLKLFKKEDTEKPELKTYDFSFTPTAKKDYYHETIMNTYSVILTNSAYYLFTQNRIEDARKYIELALTAKPDAPKTIELKKKLYNQ